MRRSCIRAVGTVALVLAAAGGSLIAGEGVAGASCAAPVSIGAALRQADVVVVGTVATTRSHPRIAMVRVEDVWKGHVGSELEVYGGRASENTATSVDRTYTNGTRYLLFVYEPSAHGYQPTFGGRYEDNNCSDTRPYTQDLVALRPAGATRLEHPNRSLRSHRNATPASHSSTSHSSTSHSNDTQPAWWILVGGAVIVAAIGTAFVIRRTRASASTG